MESRSGGGAGDSSTGGSSSSRGEERSQNGAEDRTARNVGLGCFTAFIGLWSGAMVGVLVGRIIEGIRGAPSCVGLPLCNWHVYAAGGAVLGALSLPTLVLTRLRRGRAEAQQPTRG